jgi:acyl dehydratase
MIMAINYGLDKVRFIEPVLVGSEVRAKAQLAEVTLKGPGRYLLKTNVTVEINGAEKPALIAETLSMFIVP